MRSDRVLKEDPAFCSYPGIDFPAVDGYAHHMVINPR